VFTARRPVIIPHMTRSKFTSKWDGPYVILEVHTNGAYRIVGSDGVQVGPITGKFIKLYYP